MKRNSLAAFFSILGLAFVSSPLWAQAKPQVQIVTVRAGMPPGPLAGNEDTGRRSPMFKAGHWTPVLVTLEGKGKVDAAELIVQSTDCDDMLNDYAVKVPQIEFTQAEPSYSVLTYARPGKSDNAITVRLRAGGKDLCPPYEVNPFALESSMYLYVTLGARLPGLRPPGVSDANNRRCEVAAIDRVSELPDKWFGYDSADLVILTTGDDKFADGLLSDDLKRSALIDWVRRGGKLVISVGKNHGLLANREVLKPFLPVELAGPVIPAPNSVRVEFKGKANEPLTDPQEKNLIDLTKLELKSGRGVRRVASYGGAGEGPLVAEAPFGLGRVSVVAVDLDQPPFTRWKEQGAFWEQLLRECGPRFETAREQDPTAAMMGGQSAEDSELLGKLYGAMDAFDGVPVISFGWVALFILIYIVVVGPLDYLFLKKVVKRLELTWITFPLIVLAVSAGAYFTAYALKGDDQKINKLDLIDIDMQTETIQGHTWFSIFSPRIQNFTVGVEPVDAWGIKKDSAGTPLVSWLGRTRTGRQSLFRRSYDYDTNLGGLQRVPIQVWSTKGFQATWLANLDPARPPIQSNLLKAPESKLAGSIASNLPVPLQDVVVLYRDSLYVLGTGTLLPGDANQVRITNSDPSGLQNWLQRYSGSSTVYMGYNSRYYQQQPPSPEPAQSFIRELMFHERLPRQQTTQGLHNASLRELDQSWRLQDNDAGDVAILVGKLVVEKDAAETVSNKPGTVTRLWLGALPGGTAPRPELQGTMRQETYVRVYLPVRTRK
jgi:hypothetical protein